MRAARGRSTLCWLLCAAVVPASAFAADNPHALGDWDAPAVAPNAFRQKPEKSHDAAASRLVVGASGGGTSFAFDMALGRGSKTLRLTPRGAGTVGARLALDLGSVFEVQAAATWTPTTYHEGADTAHLLVASGSALLRWGGWAHDRLEVLGGAGGGVMMLANDPDPIGADVAAMVSADAGLRWVGDIWTPRLDVRWLFTQASAADATAISWSVTAGVGYTLWGG